MKKLLLCIAVLLSTAPAFAADQKESAYDRVIRTGTLRCGYILYPPVLMHDEETETFSGVSADILAEMAKRLSLKIEWTEEAGMDVILQGLTTGRYDIVCHPLYVNSARARAAFFTDAVSYNPTYIVTRADDSRFDAGYMTLNNPQYKMAFLEGEITAIFAEQKFPKSAKHSVPQIQGYGFVLKDVAMGKADATISDPVSVANFNKANPEKLKVLQPPLVVNAVAYPIAQDTRLKEMLDVTINEMLMDGWINNMTATKYPEYWENILPVGKPYEVKK